MKAYNTVIKMFHGQGAAKPSNFEDDPCVRNILLIGPSQNGKSALANFLVSGKAMSSDAVKVPFTMGDGTTSATRQFIAKRVRWLHKYLPPEYASREDILKDYTLAAQHQKIKRCTFRVIDTPGIGDSDENAEESAMAEVYDGLHGMKQRGEKLSAALLVLKYPPMINADLERHVKFYAKMIPDVMRSNIMLIVTDVQLNDTWIKGKMKGGRPNPAYVIERIRAKLQEWLHLESQLPTDTIDSLCENETDEEVCAKEVRTRIFEFSLQAPDMDLKRIRLPKTKALLCDHQNQIKALQGEKEGIAGGIQLMEENLSTETNKLGALSVEILKIDALLNEANAELAKKNSNQLVAIFSQSYTDRMLPLWWASKTFDIRTDYPIHEKSLVVGYAAYSVDEEKHIVGTLYSPFCRKLDCHMTLYTHSKLYYAGEIVRLKSQIGRLDGEHKALSLQFNDKTNDTNAFNAKLQSFRQSLSKIDDQIQLLSSDYLLMDDLPKYFQNLENSDEALEATEACFEENDEYYECLNLF